MFATLIHTYGQLEHHKIIGYENTHDRSTLHNNNIATQQHKSAYTLSEAELSWNVWKIITLPVKW